MVAPRRTVARPNRAGFSAMTDAPMGPGGPQTTNPALQRALDIRQKAQAPQPMPTAPAQPMPMQRPIDQIPPPLQTQSQFNQPQPLSQFQQAPLNPQQMTGLGAAFSQFQQAPLQPAPTGLGMGMTQPMPTAPAQSQLQAQAAQPLPMLAAPTAPSPQQNQALFQLQQQEIDKMRAQLGSAITPQQQAALQQAQAELLERQRTTASFGPQPLGSVAPPQQFPNIGVPNPQAGLNPLQSPPMNPQQTQNLNNLYQQKFGPQPQTAPPVQLQQLPSLAMPMQPQGQFNQPQPMQTQAQLNQRPMDQMRAQTQQNVPFQAPQPAQPMGGMQNNQQQTPQQRPGQPNMGNRGGGGVM